MTCHCVHSLTPSRRNRERPESGIYLKIKKNTIFKAKAVPAINHQFVVDCSCKGRRRRQSWYCPNCSLFIFPIPDASYYRVSHNPCCNLSQSWAWNMGSLYALKNVIPHSTMESSHFPEIFPYFFPNFSLSCFPFPWLITTSSGARFNWFVPYQPGLIARNSQSG